LNNPNIQGILVGVIALLLATFIIFIVKKFLKSGSKIFIFLRQRTKEETGLELYRKTLEEKTLRISHPWMKEEQTLNDILVPINFEIHGVTEREELEICLKRTFKENQSPRILVLGKPGSGKTIAIRLIAKTIWNIDPEIKLIPVLLTFSDIKGIANEKELEQRIVEKLNYYQFTQGKKDKTTVEKFVEENLYAGKLLLLFDGYDELEKSARESISNFLNHFLGTNNNIPVVISSRTAVYEKEQAFEELNPLKISMASFTPFAILKFLSQWKFEEDKSSHELFEMINERAHLSELASNPLMLTIIAYLYSLPKYTLPDNRVEFYHQCSRALLEEWDRSQKKSRANKFEAHQKIAVLSRIAFEHIMIADETDELIHEDKIHGVTREEMQRLSLKVEEYPLMENEIVLNSGLLQHIPPSDYRFPHRTFMEFFAANYISTQKDSGTVLALYEQDPEKWKEVLLLYMGCNEKKEYSNAVLHRLKNDFISSWKNQKGEPQILLFKALTESAVPEPELADGILDLSEAFLEQKPTKEIIEELGFIAANPRWAHSKKARRILIKLLDHDLRDDVFQQVLFSLLHARDKTVDEIILNNVKRINLVGLLSTAGSRGKYFIHKLFSLDLSVKEKRNIIEGLKESGNFDILGSLLIESREKNIRELAAYALFRMSKLTGFFEFLDNQRIELLDHDTETIINERFQDWGWDWEAPKTRTGKNLAFLICYLTANWINEGLKAFRQTMLEEADNWFRYLTTGFLVEKGIAFHEFNLIGFNNKLATKKGLLRHWKNKINLYNTWYELCDITGEIPLWGWIVSILYWFASLVVIVGFFLHLFGSTSSAFYKYFFDAFTLYFVLFQFIGIYILNFIFWVLREGYDSDAWLFSFFGPGFLILIALDEVSKKYFVFVGKALLLLSVGLAIVLFLLPFHHILFNFVFSFYFLIVAAFLFDEQQLNFALISRENLISVRSFLEKHTL